MDSLLIVFGLSAVFAAIFKKLKMPLIVGFLVAGLLIGVSYFSEHDGRVIKRFAELGAAFLMLAVGLEINFEHFKKIGGTIIWMGLMQAVLFFIQTPSEKSCSNR